MGKGGKSKRAHPAATSTASGGGGSASQSGKPSTPLPTAPFVDPSFDPLLYNPTLLDFVHNATSGASNNMAAPDFTSTTSEAAVNFEIPPRLAALQRQLELLEQERFLVERHHHQQQHQVQQISTELGSSTSAGSGGGQVSGDALMAAVSATANKTELSLKALRKRLAEVRLQLYGNAPPSMPPPSTHPALLRSGVARNEFAAEGGELEGGEGYEVEFSESDFYEEDEDGTAVLGFPPLLSDIINGTGMTRPGGGGGEGRGDWLDYELVTKTEAELDAALEVLASPNFTLEEKLTTIKARFAEVIKQDLHWRGEAAKTTRIAHRLRQERELVEVELDKANSIRSRLETLCRDLKSENSRIKEQYLKLEKTVLVDAPNAKSKKNGGSKSGGKKVEEKADEPSVSSFVFELPVFVEQAVLDKEDREQLLDRLVQLIEIYKLRERHFASVLHSRDLEVQLAHHRLHQQSLASTNTVAKLDANERRILSLSKNEAELKSQVRQYVEKFRQVEETLGKSNELFGTFRGEMEQMSAKLGKLERENAQLHSKCATLSRNIIEMADERTKQNGTVETLKGQKAKLEQLCRTLQAERNAAIAKNAPPAMAKEATDAKETTESPGEDSLSSSPTPSSAVSSPNNGDS